MTSLPVSFGDRLQVVLIWSQMQVVADMMILLFRLCFSSDSSSWERTKWEIFSGGEVYVVTQECVCDSFIPPPKKRSFTLLHFQAKGMSQKAFPLYLSHLKGLSRECSGAESQTPSIANSLVLTISAATDSLDPERNICWAHQQTALAKCVQQWTVERKERVMYKRHKTTQMELLKMYTIKKI